MMSDHYRFDQVNSNLVKSRSAFPGSYQVFTFHPAISANLWHSNPILHAGIKKARPTRARAIEDGYCCILRNFGKLGKQHPIHGKKYYDED
jgi:hypothetical protein